jgi:hypothetical protein
VTGVSLHVEAGVGGHAHASNETPTLSGESKPSSPFDTAPNSWEPPVQGSDAGGPGGAPGIGQYALGRVAWTSAGRVTARARDPHRSASGRSLARGTRDR